MISISFKVAFLSCKSLVACCEIVSIKLSVDVQRFSYHEMFKLQRSFRHIMTLAPLFNSRYVVVDL